MTEQCLNCGASFKSGMFGSNAALFDHHVEMINVAHDTNMHAACGKCGGELLNSAPFKIQTLASSLRSELSDLLTRLPLASIHSPADWRYRTLGLVTAQTVTGTGMFSDITSAFTDLFGAQSGTYNSKIRSAEEMCRSSLRAQAFHAGGNAVLGVDVDYAEVGGQRAMLMVCMTGTAVKIENESDIASDFAENIAALRFKTEQLQKLPKTGIS